MPPKMIFNFFARFFGKSTDKSSEVITATIVDNDPNIVVDDDDGDGNDITISSNDCYLLAAPETEPMMPQQRGLDIDGNPSTAKLTASAECNYRRLSLPVSSGSGCDLTVQFQQQTNNKTNQTNAMCHSRNANPRRGKLSNEISVYTVYTLFASFFICICTIAVLLVAYMNRMSDIAQLRADLNGKFVGRDDIDVMVRNILHEWRIDEDDGIHTLPSR